MPGHRQGFPTPSGGSHARPERRLPRLSDGVARALRCPASPRHALLTENLGKPSLWVIISAPWYKTRSTAHHRRRDGLEHRAQLADEGEADGPHRRPGHDRRVEGPGERHGALDRRTPDAVYFDPAIREVAA